MQSVSWAQLFRESVIFQGLLALVCLIGTFVLLMTDRHIPDYIWVIDATALGFFFGAKNLLTARNAAQDANETTRILAQQNAQILETWNAQGVAVAVERAQRGQAGWQHDDTPGKFERPLRDKTLGE